MIRHIRCWSWLAVLFIACQWLAPASMTPFPVAQAAVAGVTCNTTMTSITFGNVDPNNFTDNLNLKTTGFLTYYCTNTTAITQTITACFSLGNPGGNVARSMKGPGNDTLDYKIYQDAANTIQWGSQYQTTWGNPLKANITVPANGISPLVTVPAYATIASNQGIWLGIFRGQLNAGTYTANYGSTDVALDTASGANANCASASGGSNNAFTFNVTAEVQKTCQVATDPLIFPTPSGGAPGGVTASTTLTVTCTPHTGYKVGLDNGKNYDGSNRRMRGGPTNSSYISYGLYQNSANTTPWGNTLGTNTQTGTSSTQTFNVYGKINAGQGNPSPGDYFDAVTVYVYY